jgi:hypothetical protein
MRTEAKSREEGADNNADGQRPIQSRQVTRKPCNTWSSTPAPTATLPTGAGPRKSSRSASTAAAPTTPCLHLCALACRQDRQAQENTIIRNWMPRQAAEADKLFRAMYGTTMEERFTDDKYQLMHIEMFPYHIIHGECLGGDIDLLCDWRTTVGFFPWRFVDGESCIGRCVAMVDDAKYDEMMVRKAALPKTRFGDRYEPEQVESIQRSTKRY